MPLSCWHGFWREIGCNSNFCAFLGKVFISFCFFQDFFLCVWFSAVLDMICQGVDFLVFIYTLSFLDLWSRVCSSSVKISCYHTGARLIRSESFREPVLLDCDLQSASQPFFSTLGEKGSLRHAWIGHFLSPR